MVDVQVHVDKQKSRKENHKLYVRLNMRPVVAREKTRPISTRSIPKSVSQTINFSNQSWHGIFYSQSLHLSFLKLAYSRPAVNRMASAVMTVVTPTTTGASDGGLSKLLTCPGGGVPAGKAQRSIPAGIEDAILECVSSKKYVREERRFSKVRVGW